jgi:hypothetical protein
MEADAGTEPVIRIAVVGHNSRREMIDQLIPLAGVSLAFIDDGHLGPVRNHMMAWKYLAYYTQPDDWAVVLEDDAVPVEDFNIQLAQALNAAPSPVVSLYLGRARPPHWQHSIASVIMRPESWLMANEMLHGVGIAVRGECALRMTQAIRDMPPHWPIDERIGAWCRREGIKVAYAHPSLVDHADVPSIIGPVRASRHDTDALTRSDTREPRKAWVLGPSTWDFSSATIPDPAPVSTPASAPN